MHNKLDDMQSLVDFLAGNDRDGIRKGFDIDVRSMIANNSHAQNEDVEQVFPFTLRRLKKNVLPELIRSM